MKIKAIESEQILKILLDDFCLISFFLRRTENRKNTVIKFDNLETIIYGRGNSLWSLGLFIKKFIRVGISLFFSIPFYLLRDFE
jgi:hypothetical protein